MNVLSLGSAPPAPTPQMIERTYAIDGWGGGGGGGGKRVEFRKRGKGNVRIWIFPPLLIQTLQ
jgi:hypothetical protein